MKKTQRPLHWRKEQLWVFAYVADAIIAHNIWHVDETLDPITAQKYKDHHLGSLVHTPGDNTDKINIFSNPLAFYLGLIDSIEPVKYFSHVDPRYIWDHISIELAENKIIISQSGTTLNFDKWYQDKMKELSIWLSGIYVSSPVDNVLEIKLQSENDKAAGIPRS